MINADTPGFQRWVPGPKGRPSRVFLDRWPTAVDPRHRTELPPEPHRFGGVVGLHARTEARRLLAEAKRGRVNFGRSARKKLRQVAKGERALSWAMWINATTYLARAIAGRRPAAFEAPSFRVVAGTGGLQLRRREPEA